MPIQQYVFLDNNATTPCDPAVLEAMSPYFAGYYGNPASGHGHGRKALDAVAVGRHFIAEAIQCDEDQIFFTSGASESNNIVLLGSAHQSAPRRHRIVTSRVEHKSILGPTTWLAENGFEVVVLPVNQCGIIDLDAAATAINENTLMVSIQTANNEVGTIQPVKRVVEIAQSVGALVHCDATQSLGKLPISVTELNVDFASFSGHKLYGPKGIGALYARKRSLLNPISFGGGQESDLRPGTLNVPGIVGFGEAAALSTRLLGAEALRIQKMRDTMEKELLANIPSSFIVGGDVERLPGTFGICIEGVPADALLARTPQVCAGTGSACTSGAPEPSHVLLACGLSRNQAKSVIRISIGRFTTSEELAFACDELIANANYIQSVCHQTRNP